MNARLRRLAFVVAIAAAGLAGGAITTAATSTAESTARTGLLACSLVDEATKLGLPLTAIPETVRSCRWFKLTNGGLR